jgi:hypothetical protein
MAGGEARVVPIADGRRLWSNLRKRSGKSVWRMALTGGRKRSAVFNGQADRTKCNRQIVSGNDSGQATASIRPARIRPSRDSTSHG